MKKHERNNPNYYLTLDILPGVSHNDILHAYNRAKNTYSSGSLAGYSLLEDSTSTSILQEIEKAFEILGNPARRREYDLKMGFETWHEELSNSTLSKGPSIRGNLSMNAGATPFEGRSSVPQKARLEVVPPPPSNDRPGAEEKANKNFEANPEFEKQISEVQSLDGAFLRAVRIYRQLSPESLGLRCKLSPGHVRSIEEEEAGKLHHPTYLRGHIVMICRMLNIPNGDALARNFVNRMQAEGKIPRTSF